MCGSSSGSGHDRGGHDGCRYGGARPRADFPLLADLYLRGRLKLDELITTVATFDDLEQAFADIRSGSVARTVMTPA